MVLEPMAESSEMVAEAIRRPENASFKTGGTTAGEWFARRIKNQRIKNRKVIFESSRGWVGYSPLGTFRDPRRGEQAVERSTGCRPIKAS